MKARLIKANAKTDDATPEPKPKPEKKAAQPGGPAVNARQSTQTQAPVNPRAAFDALFAKSDGGGKA